MFHDADPKGLPLVDLADLRALLTFLDPDAAKPELEGIGGLSSQTVGVLLRSLVGLETDGGTEFFGEPGLDVADLMRTAPDGRGIVPDPFEGRRRLLRHPAADRHPRRGARAARRARPARPAGLHAGRREGPARDGVDLAAVGVLRPRRC